MIILELINLNIIILITPNYSDNKDFLFTVLIRIYILYNLRIMLIQLNISLKRNISIRFNL
jgi:hypothetical protein